MSKIDRIDFQIKEIEQKMIRLTNQKKMLESKKQRIEYHSKRVAMLQQDREKGKEEHSRSISTDPRAID